MNPKAVVTYEFIPTRPYIFVCINEKEKNGGDRVCMHVNISILCIDR
jgi:hypothetical protein